MQCDAAISIDSHGRNAWMSGPKPGACSDIHIANSIVRHFALAMPVAKSVFKCSVFKPAFILEAASQVWHRAYESVLQIPKNAAWQSSLQLPGIWWKIFWHFPKHLTVKLNFFNFMQWTSCTRWDTDSTWWMVMQLTKFCKLILILKRGMKPHLV